MIREFNEIIGRMPILLSQLKRCRPLTKEDLADIPQRGIYVFYERGKPIYVGRSNALRKRIQRHSRPSAPHYSASFAYKLMEEDPSFKRMENTRQATVDKNKQAFKNAKTRIAQMQIKVVEVGDPVEQALFEIYASLKLNTKYNDFDTH